MEALTDGVAAYLRHQVSVVTLVWEEAVRAQVPSLAVLAREDLIDHLPNVLRGLANLIDEQDGDALAKFDALADTHALHRLSCGISLEAVSREYSELRRVVLEQLPTPSDIGAWRLEVVRFDQALDRAIARVVRRFTEHRDLVRDKFIVILGHDLRNPLNAATVAADAMLANSDVDERTQRRLLMVQRGHRRIAKLVDSLLDFARYHLGTEMPVSMTRGDVGEVCLLAFEEVQQANPDRDLSFNCPKPVYASHDRERLHQAVGNLLGNAVEHGSDPIHVSVLEQPDAVEIRVSNRGQAIPGSRIPSLFSAHAAKRPRGSKGLGLGLYIALLVANAHGGTCDVSSVDDETSFVLRIPCARRDPPSDASEDSAPSAGSPEG